MASETLTIPSALKDEQSGGSGHGVSFWLPNLGCARRSTLERMRGEFEAESGGLPLGAIPPELRPKDQYGRPRLDQRKIGHLFHTLMEYYHSERMDKCELLYEDGPEDLEWVEVIRLFAAYRKVRPPDYFGEVLAVEERFSFGCEACLSGVCSTLSCGSKTCRTVFGVPVFTGRLDMRTRLRTQKQVDYWRGKGLVCEKGDQVYVDTKTKTRMDSFLVTWLQENLQLNAYLMAGQLLGHNPVGMIANVIGSTKVPTFLDVVIQTPTESQTKVVHGTLRDAHAAYVKHGSMWANPSHCFDYFKECPFLNKGCDRMNGEKL